MDCKLNHRARQLAIEEPTDWEEYASTYRKCLYHELTEVKMIETFESNDMSIGIKASATCRVCGQRLNFICYSAGSLESESERLRKQEDIPF